LSAEEKLALAYSGWVLGPDAAEGNLLLAQQLWEARGLVAEYLRADDPALRAQLFEQIRGLEGIGTKRLERLLKQLPPVRDAETVEPGTATRVVVEPRNGGSATAYWVVLPPEYSPNREYPCLVALHPQGRSAEMAALLWGGTLDEPGWCQRRGYLVIAPEYAPDGSRDYTYNAAAHASVIDSLRDARLRFSVDSNRVFLAGHDLGADAAFDIGLSHPDEFAGVIPIAGVADLYCQFYLENGQQTAWYIVRGELGRDSTKGMAPWLDRMFRNGAKYDLIYVQVPGRGQELFADEFGRIMDWMDLHRRGEPPRDFDFRSLRQTDNAIHWLKDLDLPRTILLNAPGVERGGDVMKVSGRINEGNTIYVTSPARKHRIHLLDGVVDFDRKVGVSINGKTRFPAKFVQPDPLTLLEDFRAHGDRTRIASAVLEF
jgi:pimeloyl-ACP methyl ester carboxylesterase